MATQYEQGPEAKAVSEGFQLHEMFRRERGARTRQLIGEAGAMNRQQNQQTFQAGQAEREHGYTLARMMEEARIKEEMGQREAERGAPALQALMGGNPEVARVFGYEPGRPAVAPQLTRPVNPEEDEEAAAHIPRTAGSPGVERRMPTTAEAAGLVRSLPGISQAIVNKRLEANKGPVSVAQGSTLVDPNTGEVIYQGAPKPGAYKTLDEALAVADRMETARPELKGRMQIDQDSQGNYQLKLGTTTPLTPQDPVRQDLDDRVKRGLITQGQAAREWREYQVSLAGAKAAATQAEQPLPIDVQQKLGKQTEAINAAYGLLGFTKADRDAFTGVVNRRVMDAAALAQESGLPSPSVSPEKVARYREFTRLNGMVEQFKFAIGGKALTEGEQRVVEGFIPTGRENTTAEYEAKLRGIASAMEAAQATDLFLAKTGKGYVNPAEVRQVYIGELRKRGIDPSKPAAQNARNQMPSGARLREDFAPGRK